MKNYMLSLPCPIDLSKFHQAHFMGKCPSYSIWVDPRYRPNTRLLINAELEDDSEAIFVALTIGATIITV